MAKQRLNITVDLDTYMLAKIKNLNISESVNHFLKKLLDEEETEDERALENEINKVEQDIIELQQKKTMLIAKLVSTQETRQKQKKQELDSMIKAYDTAIANNEMRK